MTTHVMLDLETLGVGPFPALLSVGALKFDPHGEDVDMTQRSFYATVDVADCMHLGATVDVDTLMWWMKPEHGAARVWAFHHPNFPHHAPPPISCEAIAHRFITWLHINSETGSHIPRDMCVWSHGLNFDVAIVQRYFAAVGKAWPLGHRAGRDTRTLLELADLHNAEGAESIRIPMPPQGIKHHPVWDCYLQARAVQEAYRQIEHWKV